MGRIIQETLEEMIAESTPFIQIFNQVSLAKLCKKSSSSSGPSAGNNMSASKGGIVGSYGKDGKSPTGSSSSSSSSSSLCYFSQYSEEYLATFGQVYRYYRSRCYVSVLFHLGELLAASVSQSAAVASTMSSKGGYGSVSSPSYSSLISHRLSVTVGGSLCQTV